MKRRDDDKLIDLAFGDISGPEAARLEQQAGSNPAAAHKLAQFRSVKKDLSLLNNIPDHQLSTERLREAILRGGLKQKTNYWAWSLLPALAAAASFLLFFSRSQMSQQPTSQAPIASPEESVAFAPVAAHENVFHPDTELTDLKHAVRIAYSYGGGSNSDASDQPTKPAKAVEKRRRESYVPQEINSNMVAEINADQSGDAVVTQPQDVTDQTAAQVPTDMTAPQSADDASATSVGGDQKLIVVHDAQDKNTGAQQATEVEPTSNVVVGG